ncbi:MAG: citramalate synthase [Nitrososphaerota archaeon]|nr:citramalate synthase [Nitrososphaerota archaeon]
MARGGRIDYVETLDTTLRDGAQTRGITFSLRDKLRVLEKLDELGVDVVEAGWPGSNPKDAEFFKIVRSLDLKNSRVAAFGSTRKKGMKADQDPSLRAIVESDVPVAVIFGKSWTLHVTEVLRCSLEENLSMAIETVEYLREHGMEVIFDAEHFFDGWKASREYAIGVLRAAIEGGARTVTLCDTNGGSMPWEVEAAVRDVVRELPATHLGIHTHNDAGCGVANTLVAVQSGVRHVQGTLLGTGERCGNADLCQVLPNLALKMGFSVLKGRIEKLRDLTRISGFVADLLNLRISDNHPYVGRNAFAHKAGVHVDAVLKLKRAYEHIDPAMVGNERNFSVSELSGRSTVRYVSSKAGLVLRDDQISEALEEVKRLESQGYHLEGAEATVELLLMKTAGRLMEGFRVVEWSVDVKGSESVTARASVEIEVDGRVYRASGEGVGPVHALDNAVRRALLSCFPKLEGVRLTDYKVSVVDGVDGTAAAVRVFIEFSDDESIWRTTSVSRNIIDASLVALSDGYRYALNRNPK